jgi:predicted small secreted protein
MLNEVIMDIVKSSLLGVVLVVIAVSLGACGNTVKGIGDNMMKEEPKDVVSK